MKKMECRSMFAAERNGFSMATALKALKKSDPELIPLLDAFNIPDLEVKTNYFQAFMRAIDDDIAFGHFEFSGGWIG